MCEVNIKTTPKNIFLVLTAIAVIALLYFFLYWPLSPLGRQLQNLKIADQQADLLRKKFKDDARFQKIEIRRFTGYGGSLEVGGVVVTEEDIYSVTNIIEAMKCPVGVYYSLMTSNQLVVFDWFDKSGDAPRIIKLVSN